MSEATAVKVRTAALDDLGAIVAFNRALAAESEGLALDPERLEVGVRTVLAEPHRGRYFVAELAGQVVGCTMVTTEWSDWRNGELWWIQSVYVRNEARGKGVFGCIYREILDNAREQGVVGVRLYVERHNQRAIDVYTHLGMTESPYRVLEVDFVLSRG